MQNILKALTKGQPYQQGISLNAYLQEVITSKNLAEHKWYKSNR